MNELTIIGGGFYGIAAALAAQEIGAQVTIIDSEQPESGSRAAAGMVHPPTKRTSSRAPEGWALQPNTRWLDRLGLLRTVPEINWHYLHKRTTVKQVRLAEPEEILRLVDHDRAQVQRVVRDSGGWLIVSNDGKEWWSSKVLIAAGIWTDQLLVQSGLKPVGVRSLKGRALIVDVPDWADDVVQSWTVRPYTTYGIRKWGELWRLGETVEPTDSGRAWAEMLEAGEKYLPTARAAGNVTGYRPVTDRYCTELVADNLVVSTGGHRSGLSVAGPAADRAMALLGW